jgi:hypothetical protein
MPRPVKINEVPTAPFSLRETGPLHVDEIASRLGNKPYRTAATGKPDTKATVDPTPCPQCHAHVEWALTSKRNPAGGMVERYVYARCRGKAQHRWDFRHHSASAPHPTTTHEGAVEVKPPMPPMPSRPGAPGTDALTRWIDAQLARLSAEVERLAQIRKLAGEIGPIPAPTLSPDGHHRH